MHKSGTKTDVSNYRPISNICALSKLYERCVLNRLDEVPFDIQGENQHGFRTNRGTNTAQVTIQKHLASIMDRKKIALMYSIDMSAAFDLLRADVLEKCTADLPEGLQWCIQDFLSERRFQVALEEFKSREHTLEVGCVQGSVLGPRLFSIYCRHLEKTIGKSDAKVVTYADDSYVMVEGVNIDQLRKKAESVMKEHNQFLNSIGMITNPEKTEATIFSKELHTITLRLDDRVIQTIQSMKVLGLTFNYNLDWSIHVANCVKKAAGLLGRLRFMRKNLTQEQTLRIITSHYYSMVYYGSPVWMTSATLSSSEWRLLNTSHYKALRTAVKDVKRRWSRERLNNVCQRATPREWAHYGVANLVASILQSGEPCELHCAILQEMTINDRMPARPQFYDSSRLKVGRQAIQNRISETAKLIKEDWHSKAISKDQLRIIFKRSFFKCAKDQKCR